MAYADAQQALSYDSDAYTRPGKASASEEVGMTTLSWLFGRRRLWSPIIIATLLLSALGTGSVSAATAPIYYRETGHFVSGVFRDFWDKNGGLPNFGYPITEEYADARSGKIVQYFERARFERAGSAATEIQLAQLGREVLGARSFPTSQPIANSAQRRYFPETQHIVQYGFKQIWESRGGLAIFGLPLSDEVEEQFPDGQRRTVQWFERTRFEFWPNLPDGQRVIVSALGRQLAPRELLAPVPPAGAPPSTSPPPPTPSPGAPPLRRPLVPDSRSSQVTPQAGQPGQVFVFGAYGFTPKEKVSIWLNLPDSIVLPAAFQATADSRGVLDPIQFTSSADMLLGVWSFVAHGTSSNHEAVGYFLLVGEAIGRSEPPGPGVPPHVDARVDPPAGPAGTTFFFDAFGFRANEDVTISITRSDGQITPADFMVKADANGSIRYAGIYYVTALDFPLGLYTFTARGLTSGKGSSAYFVLTP